MKLTRALMVLGIVGYGVPVCAEEPPAAVKQGQPGPAQQGF